ncbi:MAG: hypothetical protein GDA46_06130 [Bdellovibrionales bacterium]|nr:hypothetical protein [Bdellovibrionales bacterium]
MLDLYNILWVTPGIIFIHFYNIRRPNQVIDLSGWQYLFFLVLIATLTWLPSEWLVSIWFDIKQPITTYSFLLFFLLSYF